VIEFFVHGMPVPQGSKRVINGNVVESGGARLREWRNLCADECQAKMNGAEPLTGPVSVRAMFYLPRPKTHYGTGRNKELLKGSAPLAPTARPDIDKLTRSLLDAITGIAFRDDAQVARLWAEKRWWHVTGRAFGSGTGAHVTIWEID
jgi:crossover junction endodeoxyribonuclease RusA